MNSKKLAFYLRLLAGIGLAAVPLKAYSQKWVFEINNHAIDGPYSYKSQSDPNPILGYVTEVNGLQATFLDCGGLTQTVWRYALTHVQRNCPAGSPIGTWAVARGGSQIIYLGAYDNRYPKRRIDAKDLPADWQKIIKAAKPGEQVAVSYPSNNGKVYLSFIKSGLPQ